MTSTFDQPYRGGFVGSEHRFALTVYFEDTDTAGIVYYANYLKFMERARSDMLRAAEIDQRGALEAGTGVYAVAEANVRYLRPAKLGDDLLIVSSPAFVSNYFAPRQDVVEGAQPPVVLIENKPLARALILVAKVGTVIPIDMYLAVAEVLAFVMRQRQRYGMGWKGTAAA